MKRKRHPSCHCHDNSYAASPVSAQTKIPKVYLKQGSSIPNNLMARVKTIWETCIRSKSLCPTLKGCKWGYLAFHRKRMKLRVLPWQQHGRCHFVSSIMYISGAKFEEHCPNISGDILHSVFYCLSCTQFSHTLLLMQFSARTIDCKNKHAVFRAIILFTQHLRYLGYFSL